MAGFEQRENSGALFKNPKKEKPNHPDYTGTINVEGTEYRASGWIKESGPNSKIPGQKFLSIAISLPMSNSSASPRSADLDDFDDDIPF